MDKELLEKIKAGEKITTKDIKKSEEGIRWIEEGKQRLK